MLPLGTVDVEGIYSGDSTYNTETSPAYPYSVTPGSTSSTISVLANPASPQVVGTGVTITATVTSGATGDVNFEYSTDGTTYTTVTNCESQSISVTTATCGPTAALPLGTVDLKAVYSGDHTYNSSTSVAYPYAVTPGTTQSSISVSSVSLTSPQVVGTAVTITATVPNGTGSVNFRDSTNGSSYVSVANCSSVALSGTTAQCTTSALPIGTVDLDAVYSGDATYNTSTSAAYSFVITTGSTSSSVAITSATPVTPQLVGTNVTITASVPLNAGGTVDFQYSVNGSTYTGISTCLAQSLTGTVATCSTTALPVGTVDLDAVYSGDHTYASSVSAPFAYLIRTSSLTTLAVTPSAPVAYGTSVTLTATETTGATGTVNFETSANDATFTSISGCGTQALSVTTHTATCTTTVLPTGINYLEAVYSGDATYITSTSTVTYYTVNQASQPALTITSTAGLVGTPLTLTTGGGGGTGVVTFAVTNGTASGCVVTGDTLKVTSAGTCVVTATKAADVNYAAASSAATTVTFVNPTPKALRVVGAPVEGRTTVIGIVGQYFYGQPSIITNAPRVVARVSKDNGSLLTVVVTARSGVRHGVYVFALTFKNGQRTNVKYNLR